jgi:AraC-like DNA-binding protein
MLTTPAALICSPTRFDSRSNRVFFGAKRTILVYRTDSIDKQSRPVTVQSGMCYDQHLLAAEVLDLLSEKPCLSLQNICQRIHIDRHTVTRTLRNTWGTSFRDFRREVIAKQAAHLLQRCPNLSLKEVAFQLGFSSPKTFAHFLKNMTGLTPKEYRRTLRFHPLGLGTPYMRPMLLASKRYKSLRP